jgi:hypothetical protein
MTRMVITETTLVIMVEMMTMWEGVRAAVKT